MSKVCIKESAEIALSRAKRVKALRMMTGLSREAFQRETGIPRGTQQNWEYEHGNGLTEDGARRMLTACASLNIYGSFEWLMYGVGSPPTLASETLMHRPSLHVSEDMQIISMQEELKSFRRSNKDAIDFIVPDNSMAPRFIQGEWVAGNRRYDKDIASVVERDCIVVTTENQTLLCYLKAGNIPDHYTLVASNYRSEVINQYDVKLISAAPVIWARRKEML